jgi:glycosyltransferase involved in cell wall biosynthesis
MISIIITAYKNTEFIEEAIDSIISSGKDIEFEILIGIDNCKITLEKCLNIKNKYSNNVRFLYFLNHIGTYVIRNTLATQTKYDKLLFFDSDDVMSESLLEKINLELDYHKLVRYKYISFSGELTEDKKNEKNKQNNFHVGTFGILKKIFLHNNGFEPWICAADGEFYWRLTKNNIVSKDLDFVGLYYRRHGQNLTLQQGTNMNSPLRKRYHDLKNKKIKTNDYKPLFELKISDFFESNDKNDYIKFIEPKSVSIIIPTYKNIEYIDETLITIMNSGKNHNIEILVGIDECVETLEYIKNKPYPKFVKFYYFNSNNGPYDIKNTLTQISNSDNLLFFDSDDIMSETTIKDVVNNLGLYEVIKLKYKEIIDGKIQENTESFGEGVFAIKKNIFLQMNGFEPWKVAADSDFMSRLYKKKSKIFHTNNVSFLYRRHTTSLTKRPDTGMASKLRGNYARLSKTKKGDGNPSILHTRPYEVVTTETFTITKEYDYQREIRNQKLDMIFNKTIRKSVEVPQHKKPDPVILDRLDFLYKNKTEEPRIIKTNKPNNRQELIDKKNGATKNTVKEVFSVKPNHREGKNFIHLGGKFN